jgi:hypothetical protein
MEQAANFKALLDEICAGFGPFVLRWEAKKLKAHSGNQKMAHIQQRDGYPADQSTSDSVGAKLNDMSGKVSKPRGLRFFYKK